MTSSFYPFMQRLFNFHISVIFYEPFPVCRGSLGVFVSHVLPYYCISPDDYSRHHMYVGFIILFIWLMFRPAHASSMHSVVFRTPYYLYLLCSIVFRVPYSLYLLRSVVFRAPYSLYFVSVAIGMPPPPPLAQVTLHKLETCCTCKSRLLRV